MQDMFKKVRAKNSNSKQMLLQMIDEMQISDTEDSINVDMADVKMVLDSDGVYDVQSSEQIGSTSAKRAIEAVLQDLYPVNKLNSALIVFELSPVYKIKNIAKLLDKYIYSLGDDDTSIIFGTTINKNFRDTQMKVSLLTNVVEFNYETAHKYTLNNRQYIEKSKLCGCCYCKGKFTSDEIVEYVGDNNTAICPNCSIDSIVCDKIVPITNKLLENMYKRWFD